MSAGAILPGPLLEVPGTDKHNQVSKIVIESNGKEPGTQKFSEVMSNAWNSALPTIKKVATIAGLCLMGGLFSGALLTGALALALLLDSGLVIGVGALLTVWLALSLVAFLWLASNAMLNPALVGYEGP